MTPLQPARWALVQQLVLQPLHLVRAESQHRCPRDFQKALPPARLALQLLALVARYPAGFEWFEAHGLVQLEQQKVPARRQRTAKKVQDG